jgi:hypothetical protein
VSLFDSFPNDAQKQKLVGWLVPGAVVYLTCSWVFKHFKDKYLVVVALNPHCTMLMINTEARYNAAVQTQVELFVSDYPGTLKTDCFVACDTVVDQINYSTLFDQIMSDGSRYKGHLRPDDQLQVIAAVKFATDISPIIQGRICAELEQQLAA